jgi:hypothetical protein
MIAPDVPGGAFDHLRGVRLDLDSPESRAEIAWFRRLADADRMLRAQGGKSLFSPEPLAPAEASASAIIAAGATRRGENIISLPRDETAKRIVLAGRRSRNEDDDGDVA